MPTRTDGWRYWLSWLSPLDPVWLWHALFDGTPLCRCAHSGLYRGKTPAKDAWNSGSNVAGPYPTSEDVWPGT